MHFHAAVRYSTFIFASSVLVGCSSGGGGDLPVGGPFGGALVPWAIVDGGLLPDGSGVLPITYSQTSAIGGTPTWTQLYNSYFAAGTIGDCVMSGCHPGVKDTPSAWYTYLVSQGQIGGPQPLLIDTGGSSVLSWFGAFLPMPPTGPTMNATAQKDFEAWAAAGAMNN
jgi:hypothetical protein